MNNGAFVNNICVKKYNCDLLNIKGGPILPSVNIFVKITNRCNAHCLFCSNNAAKESSLKFDINKLFDIIKEIKHSGIIVNRLNITGGEPTLDPDLINSILEGMDQNDYSNIHLHLNTNGLTHNARGIMQNPRWDSISMSLHHYDIQKLSSLYGCSIDGSFLNFDGINLDCLNLSCNLIKGYIDSTEEVAKMLDFAIEIGVRRIGFVALMRINSYCSKYYVGLDAIEIESIPHVYFIKSMSRGSNCKCSNYLYNKDAKVLEIYMRNYANPLYCESSLVYDGEYLRQGFHGDNIIY